MPRASTVLVSIAVAAVVYISLLAGIDPQRAIGAILRLSGWWWLAILGLSLCNYALRFGRWHGYIRWLGNRINAPHHAVIYIAGFALTTTPGKAGESLRALYLAHRGVPYTHSFAAFFAERFIDMLAIAVLSMLVLVAFANYAAWIVLPLIAMIGLLLAVRQRRLLNAALARFADPATKLQKVMHQLVSAWNQAFVLLAHWPLYAGLAAGLVAWGAEGLSLYVTAYALGAHVELATAIGIYAIAVLIGALSFVPGGLGGTEAVMVLLLTLTGVATPDALAITVIVRIATLWFAVAIGVVALASVEYGRRRTPPVADASVSKKT